MDLDLDAGRLLVFLGGFFAFFSLETFLPKRKSLQKRLQRLRFHLLLALFNTVLVRVFLYVPFLLWVVYVEQQGWGISRWLGLSGWLEIIISLVVLDAFDYFWHRANHSYSFLWRFHKAHHSDTEMDVSTALRFHPGELILSSIAKATWVVVWGPSAIAWFVFEALVSLCAQFHHSNIDFPDTLEKPLAMILVTPRFHRSHHIVERRYGHANFSTIFSFWDVLFGSYCQFDFTAGAHLKSSAIGLPEQRELAFSLRAWFTEPFSRRNLQIEDDE